ncbi:hypothetical protein A2480_04340 [Candidatus Uhrbacteria bacterium RIFOXYC2_FULL_47_19]|uniref:Uncharacterized protein n=1 Tax=Candidatus Uhrbacteria bacterium RIFOXYC2_FULL_47_19 TaxID=1802424 RepID=A0A1F7WED5_9BACT|nr:MAG: hypothetical protein A2480_04340 [Candidatus Uhrbacteria bacterium RIFOXYC2_FULL_47_19]
MRRIKKIQSGLLTAWDLLILALGLMLKRDQSLFGITQVDLGQPIGQGVYRTNIPPEGEVEEELPTHRQKPGLRGRAKEIWSLKRTQHVLRWSVTISILELTVRILSHLVHNPLPEINVGLGAFFSDPLIDQTDIPLTITISGWWNVLAVVPITILVVLILTEKAGTAAEPETFGLRNKIFCFSMVGILASSLTYFNLLQGGIPIDEGRIILLATTIGIIIPIAGMTLTGLSTRKGSTGSYYHWDKGPGQPREIGFTISLLPTFLAWIVSSSNIEKYASTATTTLLFFLIGISLIAVPIYGHHLNRSNGVLATLTASLPVGVCFGISGDPVNSLLIMVVMISISLAVSLGLYTIIAVGRVVIRVLFKIIDWLMVTDHQPVPTTNDKQQSQP